MFKQLIYHQDENQKLITGTDKKNNILGFNDYKDIRSIDGSLDGVINSLFICKSEEFFASSGEIKEIKI